MSSTDRPAGTTADVFQVIWNTLVGVLGTTASATLVRRAVRNAAAGRPELQTLRLLDVARDRMQFRCVLPPSWLEDECAHLGELRYFFQSGLRPLLEELTGSVVLGLLERQPGLRRRGIVENEEETP
jgi:hypothetical protein